MSYPVLTIGNEAVTTSMQGVDMSAKMVDYWDFDAHRDAPMTCPACRWIGSVSGLREFYDNLFDVRCPECDDMICIVPYPTVDQTRAAAEAGNQRAAESLPEMEAQERASAERRHLAEATVLRGPTQLPQLDGDSLLIDWDFEVRDGEQWTVLRHGVAELWREVTFWEGVDRFAEVVKILRARYGSRLIEVRPSPASELWLLGDDLGASRRVEDINSALRANN